MLDGGELLIDAAGDNATFSLKRLDITFPQLCLLNTPLPPLPLVPREQQGPSIIPASL